MHTTAVKDRLKVLPTAFTRHIAEARVHEIITSH
jgi:hypothetical protein